MKKHIFKLGYVAAFAFASVATSCTKDFEEINTDPSIVTTPDPKYLFTYSLNNLSGNLGTEWVWENLEQLLRYTQHLATDPYELSTNINSRYSNFYRNILPNLVEIRHQIDNKADKERYANMRAVTYIVAIVQGLKVTDLNGSIPYTEASKARSEGLLTPVYDSQKVLFDTWLSELDAAINTLDQNTTNQETYGNADIMYKSDWTKWIKLANSLKLRIAARYETQDLAKTKAIFNEVLQHRIGPITEDADQFAYLDPDYNPIGNDIDYRSARFATSSIISFLKKTNDPRLQIYFSPNDLTASNLDTLKKYNVSLPTFIAANDAMIQYQGGPADWTIDPTTAAYYKNTLNAGTHKFTVMSSINKKFFAPRRNGATGTFHDYIVTSAESCFYMAEFLEKGYANGNTTHDVKYWYEKGIASSIRTMNAIAIAAESTVGFQGNGDSEINDYLAQEHIKLNGTNDLERIYIQQYLNFMRLPTEAFTLTRRTGYPANKSTYYKRDPFNEPIPRRYWNDEPAVGTNNNNWLKAQQEQGFSPGDRNITTLATQRLWFDKNNPAFGEGL